MKPSEVALDPLRHRPGKPLEIRFHFDQIDTLTIDAQISGAHIFHGGQEQAVKGELNIFSRAF
jgi:hypothetical protein